MSNVSSWDSQLSVLSLNRTICERISPLAWVRNVETALGFDWIWQSRTRLLGIERYSLLSIRSLRLDLGPIHSPFADALRGPDGITVPESLADASLAPAVGHRIAIGFLTIVRVPRRVVACKVLNMGILPRDTSLPPRCFATEACRLGTCGAASGSAITLAAICSHCY